MHRTKVQIYKGLKFRKFQKYLHNYFHRITVESTYTTNIEPDLNVQVPHKNYKFLCKCLSKPAARTN